LDIHKTFPGGCLRRDKVAVHNLSMHIDHGECVGFLGPNGAGKSTTINLLSGYLRPSSGTALIGGRDIRAHFDTIRLELGVCPQGNLLWDDLTGPEHLQFYGRLKNLRGAALDKEVRHWMAQVNLTSAWHKFARQYSGGMKRRLCVAMALIGAPSVVLLDEPTTGLDPASKQALWEVINRYKRQCALLLTTHSMEEAEALCDRLGIFVAGRLATIGTAADLKARFGSGYRLVVTAPPRKELAVQTFLATVLPRATLINSIGGTQQFRVPKRGVKLSDIFAAFERESTKFEIRDWAISNTTLEEVFLFITEKLETMTVDSALLELAMVNPQLADEGEVEDNLELIEQEEKIDAREEKSRRKKKTSSHSHDRVKARHRHHHRVKGKEKESDLKGAVQVGKQPAPTAGASSDRQVEFLETSLDLDES